MEARLRLALAHHQAGRLDPAAQLYRELLADQPDHWPARHMLGVVHLARDEAALAAEWLAPVVAACPSDSMARSNLGLALAALGRPAEAIAQFEAAVRLAPGHADAWHNLAQTLHGQGSHAAALPAAERAAALRPGFAPSHLLHGQLLLALGRARDALASLEQAATGMPDAAAVPFARALALQSLGDLAGAATAYRRALVLQPALVAAANNLAELLNRQGEHAQALVTLQDALGRQPADADLHYNLGIALAGLDQPAAAEAAFERALHWRPHFPAACNNLGLARKAQGRLADAEAAYDAALALDPEFGDARWNRSLLYLLGGRLEAGWRDYERRWGQDPSLVARSFDCPRWDGREPLAGRSLLVHCEQGLGDSLQFVRYVPRLAAQGARVALEVQPELAGLMASLPGVGQVHARGSVLPACDFHIPMLSLPHAFATTLADIPADVPYLRADPQRIADWQARLAGFAGPRIGLVWAGNPRQSNDRNRSAPLADLAAILAAGTGTLFSLQKRVPERDCGVLQQYPALIDLGSGLGDFADTAALVSCLDLVISVDTAVAHLAGALGRPVWILLCHLPDWRYLLDRADSPWYPTARLFRQPAPRDWPSVAAQVAACLQQQGGQAAAR